jgi:hypothetical protein
MVWNVFEGNDMSRRKMATGIRESLRPLSLISVLLCVLCALRASVLGGETQGRPQPRLIAYNAR